ncbi:MAG: LamG-like jellyroll fold domain-containing protein [Phycisphaerae bacterium]
MRKSGFSGVLLAGIFTAFLISSQTAIADPNLIGWWMFDEGSGSTAYDSADNNPGTITGASWSNGPVRGMCLSFDGSSDYVMVGDKSNLEQQEFTLSFWARLNNPSGSLQGGIAKGWIFGSAYEFSYKIDFHEDYVCPAITNTSNAAFVMTSPIGDNGWHMWSMTVGGGTFTLYRDGVFASSTGYTGTIDYTKSHNNFVIGARDSGSYAFNGKIDDVRFYDRTLSEEEIEQIFQYVEPCIALNPNPGDGASGVDPNVVLSWSPGDYATSHDVYFGTGYSDVNDANIFSPEYVGNFDVNYWDPYDLEIDTIYYWRIDEINDANLWKGEVWSFDTRCVVPNIENKTAPDANDALTVAGFTVGNITTAYSETVEYRRIISSNPAAGAAPGCGTAVDCVVSEGSECYVGMPDYDTQWTPAGRPRCWCYLRQCKGDADGRPETKNNVWVANRDLAVLKSAWQIANGPVGPGACADFDHKTETKSNYRVSNLDLTILKSNWQISEGPAPTCLPGNRNP